MLASRFQSRRMGDNYVSHDPYCAWNTHRDHHKTNDCNMWRTNPASSTVLNTTHRVSEDAMLFNPEQLFEHLVPNVTELTGCKVVLVLLTLKGEADIILIEFA